MDYEINLIPLKMSEISEQLFNSPYLSDVTFLVEDKPIYAHSLELIKRSSVFHAQLATVMGDQKIIPIIDYRYDVFYQLIRFIYTDKYDISEEQHFDLLKLAKAYNVIRLINELLNYRTDYLQNLNFCVVHKHEIGLNVNKLWIAKLLDSYLMRNEFKALHPDTVEEILKFDKSEIMPIETDILDALICWMENHCIENNIDFVECCQKFRHLIRLIRFPTMSNEQLRDIKSKYPDLLTGSEYDQIASQKIFNPNNAGGIWNGKPRTMEASPHVWKNISAYTICKTKFTVLSDVILSGIVFSCISLSARTSITIKCANSKKPIVGKTKVVFDDTSLNSSFCVLSLGTSLRLRPKATYLISYIFGRRPYDEPMSICRDSEVPLSVKAPPNSIKVLSAHPTMLEMLFIKPGVSE